MKDHEHVNDLCVVDKRSGSFTRKSMHLTIDGGPTNSEVNCCVRDGKLLYVFASVGYDASGAQFRDNCRHFNSVFLYDMERDTWRRLAEGSRAEVAAGREPQMRKNSSVAFNPNSREFYMFGGETHVGREGRRTLLDDLWVLRLRRRTREQITKRLVRRLRLASFEDRCVNG